MVKDEDIFAVYESMEKMCFEISALFIALDDVMNNYKFKKWGGVVRWDTSKAINNPTGWLPYFTQELYVQDTPSNRALGINLLLKDNRLGNIIPFFTCGLINRNESIAGKSDGLYYAGWHDKHTKETDKTFLFTSNSEANESIKGYYLKLTAVKDKPTLEKFIVKPLINMWENNDYPDDSILSELKESLLTLEKIKGA